MIIILLQINNQPLAVEGNLLNSRGCRTEYNYSSFWSEYLGLDDWPGNNQRRFHRFTGDKGSKANL